MILSVQLKNIRKRYSSADFALEINKLEFGNRNIHVIVGPNGSGKSTLLKLIALFERPDEGNVLFNHQDVFLNNNGRDGWRKRIGFVMQDPYLFNADVFENVALGLKIRRYPRNELVYKVEDILTRLKIQHLAKRKVKYLSRGEYQKAAIAQALVLEPEIVLMDEPAANIDAQTTLSIEETIKNIQRKLNSIIIITTHSLTQAYRMSSEIISIREGKVVDFIHENVFFGKIEDSPGALQCMSVAKGVKIIFSTEKRGNTYIAVDPGNIIISKNVLKTSARNTFMGKVIKIESLGSNVRMLIDVGVQIYSIITKQSFQELNVNVDSQLVVSFKVNSVKVI